MIYKNVIRQTKKKKKRKRLSLRSSGAIVINEKTSSTFLKSSEKRRETISSKYNDIDDFHSSACNYDNNDLHKSKDNEFLNFIKQNSNNDSSKRSETTSLIFNDIDYVISSTVVNENCNSELENNNNSFVNGDDQFNNSYTSEGYESPYPIEHDSNGFSSSEYTMSSSTTDNTEDTEMEYEDELFDIASNTIIVRGNKLSAELHCPDEATATLGTYCQYTQEMMDDMVDELNKHGFRDHFSSEQGGNFSDACIKTFGRRISRFLNITHYFMHNKWLEPRDMTVWTIDILKKHYDVVFPNYLNHLAKLLQRAPNTILAELIDTKRFLFWFVYFRKTRPDDQVPYCLSHIDTILNNYSKSQRKQVKKRQSDAPDMDDLVRYRELPSGGLKGLQDIVASDMQWFHMLKERKGILEAATYNDFMKLLYSSLYAYSPQGRISGIEDVRFGQARELLQKGYVMSTKFKTNQAFGYQPVTTAEVSKTLLLFYIDTLRPLIAKTNNESYDSLFLNYNGTPATKIGLKVRYITKLSS
jgi:hypothetical protein